MSEIHRIKCGNGNCYIIENGTNGILVDTGKREFADNVVEQCCAYNVKLLILTHAHFDHAENAARISDELGIPIAMNGSDAELITSNTAQAMFAKTFLGKIVLSASMKDFSKRTIPNFQPDILLNECDIPREYGIDARIIALPGHTKGSIGVDVDKKHLIVGDALMNMFYPTVSMLYNDREEMLKSARKISDIGERTIYFGHGKPVPNRRWVR